MDLWKFIETSKIGCFLHKNAGWLFEPVLLPKPIQVWFVGHLTSAVLLVNSIFHVNNEGFYVYVRSGGPNMHEE